MASGFNVIVPNHVLCADKVSAIARAYHIRCRTFLHFGHCRHRTHISTTRTPGPCCRPTTIFFVIAFFRGGFSHEYLAGVPRTSLSNSRAHTSRCNFWKARSAAFGSSDAGRDQHSDHRGCSQFPATSHSRTVMERRFAPPAPALRASWTIELHWRRGMVSLVQV